MCRRSFVALAGAGLIATLAAPYAFAKEDEQKVAASEDLMREHGLLRRILLCYRETIPHLREGRSIDVKPLHDAARLFRRFGEDYHERMLEEAYVFPVVRKLNDEAASYPDILHAQHHRGREITARVLAATAKGLKDKEEAASLASAFEELDLMYENHAAREDTIVFPAWKQAIGAKKYDDMGEKFESIEQQQFGKDGYEDALAEVAAIEKALGFSDLSQFTPRP